MAADPAGFKVTLFLEPVPNSVTSPAKQETESMSQQPTAKASEMAVLIIQSFIIQLSFSRLSFFGCECPTFNSTANCLYFHIYSHSSQKIVANILPRVPNVGN